MNRIEWTCPGCGRIFRIAAGGAVTCRCTNESKPHTIHRSRVGDRLQELLAKRGYTSAGGCQCKLNAALMNSWGPETCEHNIETIVDWLEAAAKSKTKSGKVLYLPGLRGLGRAYLRDLVRAAIRSDVDSAR